MKAITRSRSYMVARSKKKSGKLDDQTTPFAKSNNKNEKSNNNNHNNNKNRRRNPPRSESTGQKNARARNAKVYFYGTKQDSGMAAR